VKKLLSIATAGLIATALTTAPSYAATANGSVLVKWNVQVNASMALATNYDATGANNATNSTMKVLNNGGTGTCVGPAGTNVAGTVDYGLVTTDAAKVTFCGYEDSVVAKIITNSAAGGWNLSEAVGAAPVGGFTICPIGIGPLAGFGAPGAPATYTAASAYSVADPTTGFGATTACLGTALGGAAGLTTTAANIASANFTAATPAAGSFFGEAYVLGVPANAASGAQSITVNYILTAN